MPGVWVQTGPTLSGLSLLRGQWPVICILEVPSPELCPLPCIPAERQCGECPDPCVPPGVEGLPAEETHSAGPANRDGVHRHGERPAPALCTPPSTEDWGRGVLGPWWRVSTKPLPSHVPSHCPPPSQSPLEGSHTWGGERDGGSGHPVPWPMMELAGEAAGGGPCSGTRPVPRASGFPAASVRSAWEAQLG